jgi:long-subunit fatty acid transport protein
VIRRVRRSFLIVAALIIVGVILPIDAKAQTSLQIPLQFDFINPGAKSLALGGAFAGLADDATASFANPAGLMQLVTPQLSFELRGTRTESPFLQRGRLSGPITNDRTDTIQGAIFGESVGSHVGVGYFSLVYPHPSFRWAIAGYRHELARIDQTFFSEGVFQQDPTEFTSRRDSPQEGVRQVSITGYGASGAYKLTRSLAVGGGLVAYRFSMDSVFTRFLTNGLLGAPITSIVAGRSTQEGDDVSFAPVVGGTFDRGPARIGIVYRRGASFDVTLADGPEEPRPSVFRVPHTLAFGASVRTNRRIIVSGEITRITYSRLVDSFVVDQARATGRQGSFSISDGTELHVSAQYAWPRQSGAPVRLRGGAWYDPDHSVHFEPLAAGTPTNVVDRLFDERLSTALSKGQSQMHGTAGVGLTLTPRFEFNAGLDVASRNTVLSASFIVHLKQEATQ